MDTVESPQRTEQTDPFFSANFAPPSYENFYPSAFHSQNLEINYYDDFGGQPADSAGMEAPLSVKKTYAYFGAMLGLFPPFAIFCRLFLTGASPVTADLFFFLLIPTIACTIGGYFSGVISASLISKTENKGWLTMTFSAFLVGIIWGLIAGGLGGLVFFGIGAIPGAIIAAVIGAAAFPIFTIFRRLLKTGDFIEEKHFLPAALGIALTVTALILGL